MNETPLDIGLGIDFGTKNIGLALIFIKSDIVSPLKSVLNKRHTIMAEFFKLLYFIYCCRLTSKGKSSKESKVFPQYSP